MSVADDVTLAELTLYERLGGANAIDHLVDTFYAQMDTVPEAATIRAMHPDDLGPIKAILKRYLTEWTGGPRLYSPEKGHPRLRSRHVGFPIGEAERDAWLSCMRTALSVAITDDVARIEIYTNMAKLADWMRNLPGNPHDARRAGH
ncbi:group II truncated hemoglobin [Acuticoccus sediminis]|uniref:group II truncated hemoglobin n=1 Tax=Acuticoccus sediminis TaxID=2184697 RepID=UPI001CFC6A03|nr:group II truncated hemoglobin [Acuticoccus sediminis]